jgi:hypothetical protein
LPCLTLLGRRLRANVSTEETWLLRLQERFDKAEIDGVRHLEQLGIAVHRRDAAAGALDQRRAVGCSGEIALERPAERGREERLRRLRCGEALTRDRFHDRTVANAFQRVRDRKHRHGAVEAFAQWAEQALDKRVVDERTRGVMYEHDERLVGHLGKRGGHGLRARAATGHAGDDLGGRELLGEKDRRLLPTGRRCDDDRVDEIAAIEPV